MLKKFFTFVEWSTISMKFMNFLYLVSFCGHFQPFVYRSSFYKCNWYEYQLNGLTPQYTIFLNFFFKLETVADPMMLASILVTVFWSFAFCLFFCEFGEKLTEKYESFNEKLYRCHWYAFPIEMQRMLLIFMSSTQHSPFLRGFGNIVCTRDTFKVVIIK